MPISRNLKITISSLTLAMTAYAQTEFDYPELMVTPSASVKVKMEATQEEKSNPLFFNPAVQLSAATTLAAGIMQYAYVDESKDNNSRSALAGVIVGAGWLGLTQVLARTYHPYSKSAAVVAGMPNKTKREQLALEREAESAINDAGSLADKLMIMSVVSNAAVSGFMISKAEDQSLGQLMGVISLGAAFGPLLFSSNWQRTRDLHQEYKKKIYAPIAMNTILYNHVTKKSLPGLSLTYTF